MNEQLNERIDTLAAQAFQYANEHADESGKGSLGVFAEKFAELIVTECIDIISPYALHMENSDSGHPITDIKNHFGVK